MSLNLMKHSKTNEAVVIKVLVLDIDGVLTDGRLILDELGRESKQVSFRDIDAIFLAKRNGLKIVLATGENTPWVDMLGKRLEADQVYLGAKDKAKAVSQVAQTLSVDYSNICYIGDSWRDVDAFALVGLSFAPADAMEVALGQAHHQLIHRGGDGAVAEAIEKILAKYKQ